METSILSIFFFNNQGFEKDGLFDKPFRLNQIKDFIFKKKIFDFQEMSNLSKDLRKTLTEKYFVLSLLPVKKNHSSDGTIKYLFELPDKNCIEAVMLKDKNDRFTFCISTQVGCRMDCKYCKTGSMGFIRNLDYFEILSQILFLSRETGNSNFNIVFMGMGEPLDNYDNLIKSIEILINKNYFAVSSSRITISTCGLSDKITDFFKIFPKVNLAVSLNSLIQNKREKLMPISKKFNVDNLIKTLIANCRSIGNRITLEYVLIKDINDGIDEINALKKIDKKAFLINIIPINGGNEIFQRPLENEIKVFCDKIGELGFNVTRRYRRGEDIEAACGQLYWNVLKKENNLK